MFLEIISKDNSKIKHAAKLVSSSKYRDENGLFVAETIKIIKQVVIAKMEIEYILTTVLELEKNKDFLEELAEKGTDIFIIKDEISGKISDLKTPQGIFAVCKTLDKNSQADIIYDKGKIIALEDLRDPGNIGTIIRTALALGFDGVILSENTADLYSPKMLRSTMGASLGYLVERADDFKQTLVNMQEKGFCVYAAMLDDSAKELGTIKFAKKCVVVVGNEGAGISDETADIADCKVIIPQRPVTGGVQSLNASSAASILMWEVMRSSEA